MYNCYSKLEPTTFGLEGILQRKEDFHSPTQNNKLVIKDEAPREEDANRDKSSSRRLRRKPVMRDMAFLVIPKVISIAYTTFYPTTVQIRSTTKLTFTLISR